MHLIDAHWTPSINMLHIRCDCGRTLIVRSDRWHVNCACGRYEHLQEIRDRFIMYPQHEVDIRTPNVSIRTSYFVNKDESYDSVDPNPTLPKDVMDEIQQLIGDGRARVTVSTDFGMKDFGKGTSAMCSVSLTCNQDLKTIERATQLAGELARDFAQEQSARANAELQRMLSGN